MTQQARPVDNSASGIWGEPAEPVHDELEHLYLCAECRQAVDMRDLGQVLRHEEEGDAPRR